MSSNIPAIWRSRSNVGRFSGMIFIDLRDEFGITQIVINDEKLQEQAKEFNTESCIHIKRKSCGKN